MGAVASTDPAVLAQPFRARQGVQIRRKFRLRSTKFITACRRGERPGKPGRCPVAPVRRRRGRAPITVSNGLTPGRWGGPYCGLDTDARTGRVLGRSKADDRGSSPSRSTRRLPRPAWKFCPQTVRRPGPPGFARAATKGMTRAGDARGRGFFHRRVLINRVTAVVRPPGLQTGDLRRGLQRWGTSRRASIMDPPPGYRARRAGYKIRGGDRGPRGGFWPFSLRAAETNAHPSLSKTKKTFRRLLKKAVSD
jgi:hypothetical protein